MFLCICDICTLALAKIAEVIGQQRSIYQARLANAYDNEELILFLDKSLVSFVTLVVKFFTTTFAKLHKGLSRQNIIWN